MSVRNVWLLAVAVLIGCVSAESTTPANRDEEVTVDCPVISSRNWHAWIDAMPGIGAGPTLHVTGEVELPTPGYTISWREGPLDRRSPPTQHLDLVLEAPTGIVVQVLTTATAHYRARALARSYRSIRIGCGSQTLAIIDDVTTVQ